MKHVFDNFIRVHFTWIVLLFSSAFSSLFGGWAEDTLEEMTLQEKIGQLFMIPVCPTRGEDHREDLKKLLEEFHIGNCLVKQSSYEGQVTLLNELQQSAKHPLLIAADDEWGLAMTMEDGMAFPKNRALGRIEDLSLLYLLGREIGKQALASGVHLHFAPVVDLNNNPNNCVIASRSFGSDPQRVSELALAEIRGMQEVGTLATVKHFPGHGNTNVDSHYSLPVILGDLTEELLPFQRAIDAGVDAVMIGHLIAPSIDPDLPATLSSRCIRTLLQEKMGFEGLVITDALNMGALQNYSSQEIAVQARKAGVDLLLYGSHLIAAVDQLLKIEIPQAFLALEKAYSQGDLKVSELNHSVLKILKAKEKLQLHVSRNVEKKRAFSEETFLLQKKLFEAL